MRKVISFDLIGTLFDPSFDFRLWHVTIPKLYAKQHSVSLEEAKKAVFAEYRKYERKKVYTDIDFWFRHLGLHNWLTVINDMRRMIKPYGDVRPALEKLKGNRLIIVTQADRPMLDLKLKASGLEKYFEKTFSTVSDFNTFHKDGPVYKRVAEIMKTEPKNMVHIGDHVHYDYSFPKRAGLKAYYINRLGRKVKGRYVVSDLNEFVERVKDDMRSG